LVGKRVVARGSLRLDDTASGFRGQRGKSQSFWKSKKSKMRFTRNSWCIREIVAVPENRCRTNLWIRPAVDRQPASGIGGRPIGIS
jgi:hypothetical protein